MNLIRLICGDCSPSAADITALNKPQIYLPQHQLSPNGHATGKHDADPSRCLSEALKITKFQPSEELQALVTKQRDQVALTNAREIGVVMITRDTVRGLIFAILHLTQNVNHPGVCVFSRSIVSGDCTPVSRLRGPLHLCYLLLLTSRLAAECFAVSNTAWGSKTLFHPDSLGRCLDRYRSLDKKTLRSLVLVGLCQIF